jgi:hypothetical protein
MANEETQDSGQEQEVKDQVDEDSDLFTAIFKEAANKDKDADPDGKEEEGKEEDGEGDKAGEGKDGEAEEGKDKGEKEVNDKNKGPAKAVLEARSKRLQEIMGQAKERSDEKQVQKGEKGPVAEDEGDEEPPEEDEGPEAEGQEEEDEGEKSKSGPGSLLKGIRLSKDEQEFIDDMPESVSIMEKMVKKAMKSGADDDVKTILDAQSEEIATLRTEIVITKLVPDYEEIIFDGNKVNDKGERIPNPVFWDWLNKQPELTRALAVSYNPHDNAAVLKYFKEDQARKSVKDKDDKSRDAMKKVQGIHGYTPTTKKTARLPVADQGEDDFGSHFEKAAAQKAKK